MEVNDNNADDGDYGGMLRETEFGEVDGLDKERVRWVSGEINAIRWNMDVFHVTYALRKLG